MRKDIFLAVPAAGLLFFGAAALLAVVTTPEMAHWYFAFWVGVLCTPLGAANLILLLIWEYSDPAKRDLRPKLGPALLINFAVCALLPNFGPPAVRFFRLCHGGGLAAPS